MHLLVEFAITFLKSKMTLYIKKALNAKASKASLSVTSSLCEETETN